MNTAIEQVRVRPRFRQRGFLPVCRAEQMNDIKVI